MKKVANVIPQTIPEASDVLFHFSTTETYKSFRSSTELNNGKKIYSFFVYTLTQEISKLSENDDIEIYKLLVRVNRKVGYFAAKVLNEHGRIVDDFCQAPEIRSTLRKELYLSKKNNQSVKRKRTVKDVYKNIKDSLSTTMNNAIGNIGTKLDKSMLQNDTVPPTERT